MTKNEQILFDLLTAKGFVIKEVRYIFDIPLSHYSGWFAADQNDVEYRLGGNISQAKANIESNNLEKLD